jgi:hypothetical protein
MPGIFRYEKLGGLTFVFFIIASLPDGVERLKYNVESFVTPKSLLEPVSWTLLKASRNSAL